MTSLVNFLGLDIGSRRVGVATATSQAYLASPLTTIQLASNQPSLAKQLQILVSQHSINFLVIGLPLNTDGQDSTQSLQIRQQAKEISQKLGLEYVFQEESLSSNLAENILKESKKPYRKADIDSLAACIILQRYLDEKVRLDNG